MNRTSLIILTILAIVAVFLIGWLRPVNVSENGPPYEPVSKRTSTAEVLPATPHESRQPIAQGNAAFTEVDESVLKAMQPAIEQRHFAGGVPTRYRRHKVFQIDEQMLFDQMQGAWSNFESNSVYDPIIIPLFDNQVVEVVVNNWSTADLGTKNVMGTVLIPDDPTAMAWFRFRERGELRGTIRTQAANFEIKVAAEQPYYLVMELAPHDQSQSFD